MAAEAGSPDTALAFLEARLLETQDPQTRESLAIRMKEVIIERDLHILESAVEAYRTQHRALPATLTDLVAAGALPNLPPERRETPRRHRPRPTPGQCGRHRARGPQARR